MSGKKVITVFGATGAQGGSVVRALLKDFSVRAVTRDVSKPGAIKLKEAGAVVVAADLDDEKSLENALKGAYGAFVVTNYWDHCNKEKEVNQGKRIVDLAKRLRLQHVVYSGLENVYKLTNGKLEVPHFDSKGMTEEYSREINVPMTSVRLSFYFQNLLSVCKPQKCPDGKTYQLVIPMGDIPMDGMSVDDLGQVVCSILKDPTQYIGKDIGLSADKITIKQYADIMSQVTGKAIKDSQISLEAYEKLGFPGAHEMANMFAFYHMRPDRDVKLTRKLNPEAQTFQQFMEANKEAYKDLYGLRLLMTGDACTVIEGLLPTHSLHLHIKCMASLGHHRPIQVPLFERKRLKVFSKHCLDFYGQWLNIKVDSPGDWKGECEAKLDVTLHKLNAIISDFHLKDVGGIFRDTVDTFTFVSDTGTVKLRLDHVLFRSSTPHLFSSNMSKKKVITVFGATGAQGGSVARALLEDGTFAVRAITRDPSKPAAAKLKEAGAEVVAADLDNKKSLETALSGAYGAFVVTNFWEHFSKDKEVAQGKLTADVSAQHGLTLVVFSGVENVKRLTGGKLEVPHMDGKGEVEEYFRKIGVPMTSVRLPCYFENLLTYFRPQKDKDRDGFTLAIPMDDVPLDGFSVKDIGEVVLRIFLSPSKYVGQDIGLSSEKLTIEKFAAIMTRVLGKNFRDCKISLEEYEKLDFPGARDLANMFRFYLTKPNRDVELTHRLNPKAKKFEAWLVENKADFDNL
ncbi:uncharacterized protein PAF06_013941 [Gastrophryne carolinensis]